MIGTFLAPSPFETIVKAIAALAEAMARSRHEDDGDPWRADRPRLEPGAER